MRAPNHARKAADAGVDCLIAEPTESGGYRGEQEIAMMVLIPSVRRAVPDIPLVACGTVADRAGMVAVMALGADGVQLGTRLMVTKEAAGSYGEHVAKLVQRGLQLLVVERLLAGGEEFVMLVLCVIRHDSELGAGGR